MGARQARRARLRHALDRNHRCMVGDASRGSRGVGRLSEAIGVESEERGVFKGHPNLLIQLLRFYFDREALLGLETRARRLDVYFKTPQKEPERA